MNIHKPVKLIAATFTAALLLGLSMNTSAGHGYKDNDRQHKHNHRGNYAKVFDARPIYRSISRQVPRQECHIESVAYQETLPRSQSNHYKSGTPLLLGGLVGGAIGHKLGHHKKAKNAGAIVGALLGGSIGRDLYNKNRHSSYQSQTVTRYRDQEVCRNNYYTEYEEVVDGYDVHYKYRGRSYHTVTQQHPGRRIRVDVDVRPSQRQRY